MKFYDVVSGRKVVGQDKKRWTNVGIAFEGMTVRSPGSS